MTNEKFTIPEMDAKVFERFAVSRETPARQSKPAGHAAPVRWFVYPANVAALEALIARGRSATLVRKNFS
jgi:hypothetical protein